MRFQDYEARQLQLTEAAIHTALVSKFDANETAFLERELTFVRQKIFQVAYAELRARLFVPKATDIPPWADTHTYKVNDRVGKARVGSYQSKDIPRVDVHTREVLTRCVPITDSFAWNIDEMRKAAALGLPLTDTKALAARMAIETAIDEIVASGVLDSQTGLPVTGFLNNADVVAQGIVNPANDPWDATTTTADQMLADLNAPVNTIVETSNNIFIPDTMLLPPREFNLATQKRIGVDSSMTVLQFFLSTNPYIKNVDQWTKCTGAGAAGASRGVVYRRDPAVLEAIINQEFEALPPQVDKFEFEVPCHAKCGGTVIYQPMAVRYVDFAQS